MIGAADLLSPALALLCSSVREHRNHPASVFFFFFFVVQNEIHLFHPHFSGFASFSLCQEKRESWSPPAAAAAGETTRALIVSESLKFF